MPVQVTKHDTTTRVYTTYKLYRKSEIKKEWSFFKELHLRKMSNDVEPYVSCVVEDEESAVVLIALLMRKTNALPSNFYYDDESKRLLANCIVPADNHEKIRKQFLHVLYMFLPDRNLRTMEKDPVGNELFKTDDQTTQDAYEVSVPRGQISWMDSEKLHEHFSIYGCMGINVMGGP
jgi:hypothetical protein